MTLAHPLIHAARPIAGYLLGCRCGPMLAWQAGDSRRLHNPPERLAIRATPAKKPVNTMR